jgi:hypothetical protein
MTANKADCGCKPCDKCKVWEKLATDSSYRQLKMTRTIGGRLPKGVHFIYLPASNEVEIQLPRKRGTVSGYPKRFTDNQFKLMCCRFSYVTRFGPNAPSQYRRNQSFNDPGWCVPGNNFENPRIDPPYLVAVVRKVIEDDTTLTLNWCGYCPCQNNCK